jgi:glycine dehydrogenase subunit 2
MQDLLFELTSPGRTGYTFPKLDVPRRELSELIPSNHLRTNPARLPEVSEIDVVRHFIALSSMNHHVDKGFYPLGSCTMKYNPKISEDMARLGSFTDLHPLQPDETVQGALQLMYELGSSLCELSGMDEITLQPAAGAQGELVGIAVVQAYHRMRGEHRHKILVPDSAHGTNPASTCMAGCDVIEIPSNERGLVDLNALRASLDEQVSGVMLTVPNTLGLFESQITEISRMVHEVGAQLYMDGANLNALMGIVRPADMGFDLVHFNLHKTFSTPHGGGGPGSGPLGVKLHLAPFLPIPMVVKDGDRFQLDYDRPNSIGKVLTFHGHFGVMVKAYIYIRMLGSRGLRRVSENAIINANYVMRRLEEHYDLPYTQHCMHECVLSGDRQKKQGVRTMDIAKRLLDFGLHAPTVYFPLIVSEALMIEPTETESRESLDAFCDAMIQIAREAETDPEQVRRAPQTTPVGRLDEATASRELNVCWQWE